MIKLLDNTDKDKLFAFELMIRKSEPDIWPDFDQVAYRSALQVNSLEEENNRILAYMIGDKIVARCDLVIMTNLMDFKRTAYIDWLYVEINHRNQGIAGDLLNQAKVCLKEMGCQSYYLFTAGNDPAQLFYKNRKDMTLTMKEVGEVKW